MMDPTLRPLQEVIREHVIVVMEATKGNKRKAANILQISRRGLDLKLETLGLSERYRRQRKAA